MTNEPKYDVVIGNKLVVSSRFQVGIVKKTAELFLYRYELVDNQMLVTVYRKGIVDSIGFSNYLKEDQFIALGDL